MCIATLTGNMGVDWSEDCLATVKRKSCTGQHGEEVEYSLEAGVASCTNIVERYVYLCPATSYDDDAAPLAGFSNWKITSTKKLRDKGTGKKEN